MDSILENSQLREFDVSVIPSLSGFIHIVNNTYLGVAGNVALWYNVIHVHVGDSSSRTEVICHFCYGVMEPFILT